MHKNVAVFWMVVLFLNLTPLFATNNSSMLSVDTTLNFIAPSVYDVANVANPDGGLIVFDSKDHLFKGKTWNSGWQVLSPGSAVGTISTITQAYSILSTDDVLLVDGSGGAFTVTLPSAVSNSGKVYEIKRTDETPANTVTVGTTSSQTIDGSTTTTLNTQYEVIKVVSNGTNWSILGRSYPQSWTSYALTITGVSSNPTLGTTSINNAWWRRVGDSMEIRYELQQTSSGTAGSGIYKFSLPSGYSIDGAKTTTYSVSSAIYAIVGGAEMGATGKDGTVIPYDATNLALQYENAGITFNTVDASNNPLSVSDVRFTFFATVPISGWK